MSTRYERIASNFAKEISYILMTEIKDPMIKFVTVTDCEVTNDLSFAKVYVTVLDQENKDEILSSLNNAHEFIEMTLSKRIEIRKMPKISFLYDESMENGQKIEEIINKLHKDA